VIPKNFCVDLYIQQYEEKFIWKKSFFRPSHTRKMSFVWSNRSNKYFGNIWVHYQKPLLRSDDLKTVRPPCVEQKKSTGNDKSSNYRRQSDSFMYMVVISDLRNLKNS
jgi:hypothetical protein